MNLYVDDQRPCPPGWVLARTVDRAIELLATGEVDVASLDHDIVYHTAVKIRGERVPIEVEAPETFEAVARYIARMPPDERPDVRFHTANAAGEAAMREILRRAEAEDPA